MSSILKPIFILFMILSLSQASQRGIKSSVELSSGEVLNTTLFGNYKALIIGNEDYRHLEKLKTPINDANKIADVLKDKYGFKQKDVKVLHNATREEIVSTLYNYANNLKEKDNLLIYYAGHGYFDKESDISYWLPIDAKENNDVNWIIATSITSKLKKSKAKHILVIADSCYSGTLSRNRDIKQPKVSRYIKNVISKKSRILLASGGNEPVSDGNVNSVFAKPLIEYLKNCNEPVVMTDEIFKSIREVVAGNSEQTPQYSTIRNSGHSGGEFVFVNHNLNVKQKEMLEDLSTKRIKQLQDEIEILKNSSKKQIKDKYGNVYKEVISPYTGRVWLDRNLGAKRVCQSFDDEECYGDYFQWGRDSDGHEKKNSETTSGISSSSIPNHSQFIKAAYIEKKEGMFASRGDWIEKQSDYLWQGLDGENNPCPKSFRVPTIDELLVETIEKNTIGMKAMYNNFLKLPATGIRYYRDARIGGWNGVWSSSTGANPLSLLDLIWRGSYHSSYERSYALTWNSLLTDVVKYDMTFKSLTQKSDMERAYGIPIRCIKN